VGVPRSVRGRPSQVKGAFGVADAMPLRGTLDLRASTAPGGQWCGQAGACPSSRAAPPPTPTGLGRWGNLGHLLRSVFLGGGGCQAWAVGVIAVVRVR
jgi:hypothetical protein